jgi:integrase
MLTDVECKNAKCSPEKRQQKFNDANGLYLLVKPNGSKSWFYKYRVNKIEKHLALGTYPKIGLMAARKARDIARIKRSDGVDPIQEKKVKKLKAMNPAGDSFRVVAAEWYQKQVPTWSLAHAKRTKQQLERDLFPWLGDRRLSDIEPVELLATIRKTEARGALETASRGLSVASLIWRYGVATGRVDRDIAADLKGALTPFRGTHFAAITDPKKLGELLRAIRAYRGGLIVRTALQLAPMLFQRPGELRAAAWSEMDLEKGLWTVPSSRMKRTKEGKENGQDHMVPLPRQAVELLRALRSYTGHSKLVFPGERNHDRPISENSVRTALISMGYTSELQTWHGFRATARTMLAERLEYEPQIIEAQLAHAVRDANGRAYNRTTYLDQRSKMMQTWADFLDKLAIGADVIELRAA